MKLKMKYTLIIFGFLALTSFVTLNKNKVIKESIEKSYTAYLENGEYLPILNDRTLRYDKIKQYSNKGLLKQMELTRNKKVRVTVKITNNENGKFKLQEHYNEQNELTKKVIRKSDSLVISYDPMMNKISQDIESEINEFELLTETTDYRNNTLSRSLVKRDSNKNVVYVKNEFVFNNDTIKGETFVKYTGYDEHGNWISSLSSINMKFDTVQIKNRTIKYY